MGTNWYNKIDNDSVNKDNELVQKYIIGIKEYRRLNWHQKLETVKQYIDEYQKRPSKASKYLEIRQLGSWISNQQQNYALRRQYLLVVRIISD